MVAESERGRRFSDPNFVNQVEAARRSRELIDHLAKWRSEHGPSQAETAKRMHTSQPAIARLESHQHDAQLSTLARYVAAMGISLDFVLTDSETGTSIWTSMEEPEDASEKEVVPSRPVERAAPAEAALFEVLEQRGFLIIDEAWNRLSKRDLESEGYVVTASEEPGWDLVYTSSEEGVATIVELKRHGGRTETAVDSQVWGFFGPEDPDPVAIATATEPDANEFHQVHTLVAKVRAEDELSVIRSAFSAHPRAHRHFYDTGEARTKR
jgi:transcriptional regulator with XRE-family HTH domain